MFVRRGADLLLGLWGGLFGSSGSLLFAFVVGNTALLFDVFVGLLAHSFFR
jgi:hypothetical protein